MEIIAIIAIVTLALLFIGRAWRQTFKNNNQSDCTSNGGCRGCYGCGTTIKPATSKRDK